jgi:hypothetical protein
MMLLDTNWFLIRMADHDFVLKDFVSGTTNGNQTTVSQSEQLVSGKVFEPKTSRDEKSSAICCATI